MAALKVLILALLSLAAAFDDDSIEVVESMKENLEKLGLANNFLSVNLLKKMSFGSRDNLFFSPFTLFSVLGMLYKGAKGETAQELRKALGYHRARAEDSVITSTYHYYLTDVLERMDRKSYTIYCNSALIVDSSFPLSTSYKTQMQDIFQAYIEDVDMKQDSVTVADRLNTWIKIKSKGTIKSLVEAIDPTTVLLLLSAAYFKADWKIKFDPKDTKLHPFYNGGLRSNRKDILMMHARGNYRYYDEDGDFTAIELAYVGKDISMVIFLPVEIDGLYLLEQSLSPGKMAMVRRRMYYTKVHLTMPKFKLEFQKDISEDLRKCGVNKVFTPTGDLSGMTVDKHPLAISQVAHKAMIEVNEEGSVAAAITTVIMTKMMPTYEETPEFRVNHPFLFTIIDTKSGLILFLGRVNNL